MAPHHSVEKPWNGCHQVWGYIEMVPDIHLLLWSVLGIRNSLPSIAFCHVFYGEAVISLLIDHTNDQTRTENHIQGTGTLECQCSHQVVGSYAHSSNSLHLQHCTWIQKQMDCCQVSLLCWCLCLYTLLLLLHQYTSFPCKMHLFVSVVHLLLNPGHTQTLGIRMHWSSFLDNHHPMVSEQFLHWDPSMPFLSCGIAWIYICHDQR